MIKSMSFFVFCVLAFLTTDANTYPRGGKQTSSNVKSTATFHPYRFQRLILFFFSKDVTASYFKRTVDKLFELDEYCGGQELQTVLFDQNRFFSDYIEDLKDGIDEDHKTWIFSKLNTTIAWNISSGTIDQEDVNNITSKLLQGIRSLDWEPVTQSVNIISQIVLITDYATDSLRIESENRTGILDQLKWQKNITFIALTTNLTNAKANEYFPNVWNVFADYSKWTPNNGMNPICGYETAPYTTPIPQFSGELDLYIYLLFSSEYINRKDFVDIISLLSNLTVRRWSYPCRQFREIFFEIRFPTSDDLCHSFLCAAEDSYFFNSTVYNENQRETVCSTDFLNQSINAQVIRPVNGSQTSSYNGCYHSLFNVEFPIDNTWMKRKFLLITDVPLPCNSITYFTYKALEKYSYFKSGAPLIIIAIDKANDSSVFNSYKSLFPPSQLPNLYPVKNIADLLPNITTNINFCLDSIPWLPERIPLSDKELPYHKAVWYYYLIGAAMFFTALVAVVIILLKKRMKRDEILKEMRKQRRVKAVASNIHHDELSSENPAKNDIWEVSTESLDIDFINFIGKGAFSIVYSGILRGKAPVVNQFPLVALQQYADCEVAIKTLPQHSQESDKAKFLAEIELMKEIGFHVHLVSILGCNCSIEIPILLLELAEQDLLRWLKAKSVSIMETNETETNLDKTLLSLSWQISDGMSYLSSKHLVHRDLAARNVLLTAEMKAMIGDFGLCQKCDGDERIIEISGGRLPLKWMALESLQDQVFSLKTDVWSFGILMFEIFSLGLEPYKEIASQELTAFLLDGQRLSKPNRANDQIYELMRQCWNVEPSHRPEFSKIQSYFARMLEDSTANYGYLLAAEEESSP